jgi:translocation and assembly module TamA
VAAKVAEKSLNALAGLFAVWAILALSSMTAIAATGAELPPSEPLPAETQDVRYLYEVRFRGVSGDLENRLRDASQLIALESSPPPTLNGLHRRAQNDLDRLRMTLRSEAYHAGRVTYAIDADRTPARVTIQVQPGPQFILRDYAITYTDRDAIEPPEQARLLPADADELGFEPGEAARGRAIVAAEGRVIERLRNVGFPYARVVGRTVRADMAAQRINVALTVETGGFRTFGPIDVSGLEQVDEVYVRRFAVHEEGEPYDHRKVVAFSRGLERSGLFARIRVAAPDEPPPGSAVPLSVTVSERKHRSLGVGVNYSTNEGAGGRVFWEHRNLWGRGQTLRTELNANMTRQRGSVSYRMPHYRRTNQTLTMGLALSGEQSDAFDEIGGTVMVGIERELWSNVSGFANAQLSQSRIKDSFGERDTTLFSLPLGVRWDTSNDILDPTSGFRLSGTFTPHFGAADTGLAFMSLETRGTFYYSFDEDRRFVAAARARAGSIIGSSRARVPAPLRFYSGGGGSVRGFGYQLAGPLAADNSPIGGRSVFEAGFEMRVRVTETIGIVPFVEGGGVFEDEYPSLRGGLFWGGGIGVRYFTPIGPVRLDVAVPFNPRSGVDDRFQIYISLGQAF